MSIKYQGLISIIKIFFPFFQKAHFKELKRATDFNFSDFSNCYLELFSLLKKETSDSCLIISKDEQSKFQDSQLMHSSFLNFNHFGASYDSREIKPIGIKNLTELTESWKKDKIIIFLEHKDQPVLCVFSLSFFSRMLGLTGLAYCLELDVSVLNSQFYQSLDSLELIISHSGLDVYFPFPSFFKLFPEKENAFYLHHMLKEGYLTYSLLASLKLFYPEIAKCFNWFSSKDQQKIQHNELLQVKALKDLTLAKKWKRQFFYSMQTSFSHFFISQKNPKKSFQSEFFSQEEFIKPILKIRVELRKSQVSYQSLFEKVIELNAVNSLISSSGKEILSVISSLNSSFDLSPLYDLYTPVFKSELQIKIDHHKKNNAHLSVTKREELLAQYELKFYTLLELALIYRLDFKDYSKDLFGFEQKIRELTDESLYIFYEKLGFLGFAKVFEIFKYSLETSLPGVKADTFFRSRISSLPLTQRSIVADIYEEQLNVNRVMNEKIFKHEFEILTKQFGILSELRVL